MLGAFLQGDDPKEHLAIEELLLGRVKNGDEPILLFYQNRPSVIIGSYQNTFMEADCEYIKAEGIELVRRISGGGSVYHGFGNVCFAFITTCEDQSRLDVSVLLKIIVDALEKIGISVTMGKRNDLWINGKKICGTAARILKNAVLFHGTLLYDLDLSKLHLALNGSASDAVKARGTASVKSVTANIKDELSLKLTRDEFVQELMAMLSLSHYQLDEELLQQAGELVKTKYGNDEWTIGRDPEKRMADANNQR